MTRRIPAVLIVVVRRARVAVAGRAILAAVTARTVSTSGADPQGRVDVEAGTVEVVAGQADEAKDGTDGPAEPGRQAGLSDRGPAGPRGPCPHRPWPRQGREHDGDGGGSDGGGRHRPGGAGTRGPVRATTSAGNIDGVDLVAGFLDATTEAGPIRLSLAEPSAGLGLRTDAGNIDLSLPEAPEGDRVTTETGAGRVEVGVAQEATSPRAVTATTGAGNIRIRIR